MAHARKLYVDIETYSDVDIKKFPVYRYVESPVYGMLMAAWAWDDDPIQVAIGEDEIRRIPGLVQPGTLHVAHNAAFERINFSRFIGMPSGSYLDPADWHDTQAVAGELGYPQSLGQLAVALGAEPKDEAGTRLITLFCKPNRKGQRNRPEDYPEEWAAFVEYCRQDVSTLRDIDRRIDWPTEHERLVYLADQRINDRGIEVDVELAEEAVVVAEDNRMEQELELSSISGVLNPGSPQQMLAWLKGQGLPADNMQKETVERLLLLPDLTPTQRRVLELRQDLALVASKKFQAALGSVCDDGRLRGSFRFFGAHTGRWTGGGVQMHNLPREQLPTQTDTNAAILDVKLGLGADSLTLKALVRAMFVGPYSVVDYAAIEARVIAWLAGEQWALDAFYAGRDIYVETAERMSTPGKQLTRSQGKVAVLALGYNGGINSLRVMGAEGTDVELQFLVDAWRLANSHISGYWRELGEAFHLGGAVGDHLTVEVDGDSRHLRLPSGRAISYHGCKWTWVNGAYGRRREASFLDPKKSGMRVRTYGGKLSENVTQAVARDVLAAALVRLDNAGLPVVGHVHDEVLVEGKSRLERTRQLMTEVPAWATGLPINGEGFTTARYRKG